MRQSMLLLMPVAALSVALTQAGQQSRFDAKSLSESGRQAYQKLAEAKVFRLGGVGYAGETSDEERALRALLKESSVVEALESLVEAGSPEGGLYGLAGLRQIDKAAFRRAYGRYVVKEEPPERPSFLEEIRTPKGEVTTQTGCIVMAQGRKQIAAAIDSGRYDKLLRKGVE